MKSIVLALTLSFALAGSAAGPALAKAPPRPIVKPGPSHPPVNPTPKTQLIDAGASCSGTACTFHGTTWDCSDPNSCHTVKSN